MEEACCTCAQLLHTILPVYDEKSGSEKSQQTHDRTLDCCGRTICGNCIANNHRFATYCPFCQISTEPTSLPQGLKDPPSYTNPQSASSNSSLSPPSYTDELPAYSPSETHLPHQKSSSTTTTQPAEDVLHFLDHSTDTLAGLSLRYGVPIQTLRKVNKMNSDHLLLARRTIIISGEFYKGGVSLSPRPIEGEEEERRKGIVRRFMVGCKVSEYDIALLYLKQADYDLDAAIEAYKDDERWEREHPIEANVTGKGKGKTRARHDIGRRRFTGQT